MARPLPQENFYLYVNYEWLQSNEIPQSESRWGTFDILNHKTLNLLKEICEDAEKKGNLRKGSNLQLASDFYSSGINLKRRNILGVRPLQKILSQIENLKNNKDIVKTVADLHLMGVGVFFAVFVYEDFKNAGRNAFYIEQSGLGMPNRDYYLRKEFEPVKEKYKVYIANLFKLLGKDESELSASVLRVEQVLAEASLPEAEIREVDKNYFKYSKNQAIKEFPDFEWEVYFDELGIGTIREFVIMQPKFIKAVNNILQSVSLKDLKNYLIASLVNVTAGMLSEEFIRESFLFNEQILQGIKEQKPLWKKIISRMHQTLITNAIGPVYCEKYFKLEDKTRIIEMVENIKESFKERVINKGLSWMSESTKKLTLEKLQNITFKIGYPDKWIDISGIDIEKEEYFLNNIRLAEFEFKRKLRQLGEPFDRSEWLMPPTLVNAYSDLKREMAFPAAILQPPIFNSSIDDAYNYGAIGAVIGHELSHFFDDQGCKFDSSGNMRIWWKKEDSDNFKKEASKFVEYFSKYDVKGIKVNGKLTLGENIADVAGVAIAFEAFERYLQKRDLPAEEKIALKQKFFIGYAKIWAGKITDEKAKEYALRDPHSPGEVRVNAVLSVTSQFLDVFKVEENNKMFVPVKNRVKIW